MLARRRNIAAPRQRYRNTSRLLGKRVDAPLPLNARDFERSDQGEGGRVMSQLGDFVFELQFTAFEFGELQFVNRGMDQGFVNLPVERFMALLESGQMIFDRHAELLVEVFAPSQSATGFRFREGLRKVVVQISYRRTEGF